MAFLLQGLAFIILFPKAAMASLKKKKKHNDSLGSVTARDEMLRFNFKNSEVGLGEKKQIRSDQWHPTYIHV